MGREGLGEVPSAPVGGSGARGKVGVGEGPGFGGAGLGVGIFARAPPPGTCGRRKLAAVTDLELRGRALPRGTLWYSGRAALASFPFPFLFLCFSRSAARVAFPRGGRVQGRFPAPRAGMRRGAGPGAPVPPRGRGGGRRSGPALARLLNFYYGAAPVKVVKKSFGARVSRRGSRWVFGYLRFRVVVEV